MMTKRRLLALVAFLSLAGAYAAGAEEAEPRQQLISGAKALAARDDYLEHCADCHGERGAGSAAEVDFSSPQAVAHLSRDAMIEKALNGHGEPDAQTAVAGLSESSAAAIVDYIREILMLPAPLADASAGRQIYAHTCSVCHGERGNAASWAQNSLNPPPFDFTSAKAREIDRERMIHSVTYGVPDTAMMPFATQLSRDEIAAVVDYIEASFVRRDTDDHSLNQAGHGDHAAARAEAAAYGHGDAGHAGHHIGPADADAPFPDGLIGDIEAGENFYARNCAECHGVQGDGQGRRAYFMNPKPADLTSAKARAQYDRPNLFAAISGGVRGSEMPAWSKVIGPQRIADVAEYVYRAFVSPAETDTSQAAPAWTPRHDDEHKKKH